ncbi:DUF6504 family protein [Geomonas subterranea]|uniref:DUF6504 domain-containing protein n=1 Tax=Geomonas subterranea TaxID=2847989 RepID=A0ABX8LTE4_9BACT|nr:MULTISPECIES: DUF6504 family protein [Geomonas]QXE92760.1 hypothetical protein KP001_09670 [Geomonas subterranea]QXM09136.1 hypothetical protein KP002_19605 [Geomonas subterranea]
MGERVRVTCYAGYKADERPTAFIWRDRTFTVTGVLDRWYDRDGNYFMVQVEDGGRHLLRHDLNEDLWELVLLREE